MRLTPCIHMAEISFDKERHRYYRNGIHVPSVTRVIRETGLSFFGSGDPVETPKMRVGTWIHEMLRLHFLEKLDESEISPPMKSILDAVKEWMTAHGITPLAVEVPLVHSLYWYGGMPDLVGFSTVTDEYIVIDWKWGVASPSYRVQVGAYVELVRNCYKELKDNDVVGVSVYLRDLLAAGPMDVLRGSRLEAARQLFLSAHATYRFRVANGLLSEDSEEEDEREI